MLTKALLELPQTIDLLLLYDIEVGKCVSFKHRDQILLDHFAADLLLWIGLTHASPLNRSSSQQPTRISNATTR